MAGEKLILNADPPPTVTDVAPLIATVISSQPSAIPSGTVAHTPGVAPNVIVQVVQPIAAILVRFVNTFLTTLVGLVVAGMTPAGGAILRTSDFGHLLLVCASLSLPGAGVGLIKDLVTVFGRLETKYPLLTGSV